MNTYLYLIKRPCLLPNIIDRSRRAFGLQQQQILTVTGQTPTHILSQFIYTLPSIKLIVESFIQGSGLITIKAVQAIVSKWYRNYLHLLLLLPLTFKSRSCGRRRPMTDHNVRCVGMAQFQVQTDPIGARSSTFTRSRYLQAISFFLLSAVSAYVASQPRSQAKTTPWHSIQMCTSPPNTFVA